MHKPNRKNKTYSKHLIFSSVIWTEIRSSLSSKFLMNILISKNSKVKFVASLWWAMSSVALYVYNLFKDDDKLEMKEKKIFSNTPCLH